MTNVNYYYYYYGEVLIIARQIRLKNSFQFVAHIVVCIWNSLICKHLNKTIYCYEVNSE
jgi:hypothetical protein